MAIFWFCMTILFQIKCTLFLNPAYPRFRRVGKIRQTAGVFVFFRISKVEEGKAIFLP
jgi:hypothetical protein